MRATASACLLLLLLLLLLGGCTLFSKGAPQEVRYFSPEGIAAPLASRPAQPSLARLRLGRLRSSANLRSAIVHRESSVEVEPYETLRWTENPEEYVRRSLSRALFEDGSLEQVVGGAAVTLDVELVAFEEARRENHHVGRIQIAYQLHDDRSVLGTGTVTIEREAVDGGIESVVAAIGSAMEVATAELARDVVTRLRAR